MINWDALQYFHFLRPWWLLGVLPFILFAFLQMKRSDLIGPWTQVIAPHLLSRMIVQQDRKPWQGPLGMMLVVIVLLCIALAGPSWEKRSSPFSEDNSALIIALDVSQSMDQGDIQPSRLLRAKQKVSDLLALRGDSYTGLIAYAGTAHTVLPLSNDRQVILHFLDAISTAMMPRAGKSPEQIFPIVDRLLNGVTTPATVLLISDGSNETSIDHFKQYFDKTPHQLLVWGIGMAQDALNEQAVDGYQLATIPLLESSLKEMAAVSNGKYQLMSIDKSDVETIYRRIDNYYLLSEDDNRPWIDAGYWLVFPILLLFLSWFRRGWVVQW